MSEPQRARSRPRLAIPVPGLGREVGLGRVIARLGSAFGVPACGGCKRRAAVLDGRVVFRSLRRERAAEGKGE
jgi:hypothetical protein